jgi:hypothetical protein
LTGYRVNLTLVAKQEAHHVHLSEMASHVQRGVTTLLKYAFS